MQDVNFILKGPRASMPGELCTNVPQSWTGQTRGKQRVKYCCFDWCKTLP